MCDSTACLISALYLRSVSGLQRRTWRPGRDRYRLWFPAAGSAPLVRGGKRPVVPVFRFSRCYLRKMKSGGGFRVCLFGCAFARWMRRWSRVLLCAGGDSVDGGPFARWEVPFSS